jgi:predicted ATPase
MISNISINGYKSLIGPINFKTSNLNVFVGANASGKSSILQALLLLRQSSSEHGILDGLHLSGPLYEAGTALDVLHPDSEHRISFEIEADDEQRKWEFVYDRTSTNHTASRVLIAEEGSQLPPQLYQRGSQFAYLNAERIGPRVNYALPPDGAHLAGYVGKHGEYTAAVLARGANSPPIDGWERIIKETEPNAHALAAGPMLIDFKDVSADIMNSGGRVDLLSNIMLDWIIPGSVFSASENPHADSAAVRFVRDPRRTRSEVRSTHIGFGLSYTLPIIVAAISLRDDGMLLVENPEAHLHPYSQSRIGAFLAVMAATGRQIFVETHSDHVINGIRLAIKRRLISEKNVYINFLERSIDEDRSTLRQIRSDADGRLSKWPAGFFDQIENDLSQL